MALRGGTGDPAHYRGATHWRQEDGQRPHYRQVVAVAPVNALDLDAIALSMLQALRTVKPARKCAGNSCGTILRESNLGKLCSICERKDQRGDSK